MKETYRVIFKGDIVDGAQLSDVKNKLCTLFKSDISKIEKLFSKKSNIIIKNADIQTCKKLKKAAEKAGAIFIIEPHEERQSDTVEKADNRPTSKGLPPKQALKYKIIEDNNCPLYKVGEEFELLGYILSFPVHKPTCTVLVEDVINFSVKYADTEKNDQPSVNRFKCSGCQGTIVIEYERESNQKGRDEDDNYIGIIAGLLSNFPIYQAIEEHHLREFCSLFKPSQYNKGDTIIRKGEQGNNLYIIVSGKVEVLGEGDMSIAFMEKGEVFGEMSLLSGSTVGATIKAAKPSTILYMSSVDFKRILNKSSALQMYFNRLLVRRMTEINLARSEEFASGITGKLSEMPPSELFQTFNINQKTGVLTLELTHKSQAQVKFREGELIDVKYGDREGEDAFFELLKLKKGRFRFTPGLPPQEMDKAGLGDFMTLLMEGLRRIDEADKKFLRTILPGVG